MSLRKLVVWPAVFLILVPLALGEATPSLAEGSDPYALIDAVNQYRAANGLYPYRIDSALMISAQIHSNYQASLGTWTHTGAGGTDETQRAAAAGYGGGARILCDENVAFGLKLSPEGVIQMWQDPAHLANLLSTRYIDAGAGATVDGTGRVFYTLNVCVVLGQSRPAAPAPGTPWPTALPWFSVQTATPNADGTLIHVVKAGQNLILISKAYGVTLDDLLALNHLDQKAVLQPDQKLVISLGSTAIPTADVTATATRPPPQPTSTRRPTRTPTPSPAAAALVLGAAPASASRVEGISPASPDRLGKSILAGVGIIAVAGVVLVILGSFFKRGA